MNIELELLNMIMKILCHGLERNVLTFRTNKHSTYYGLVKKIEFLFKIYVYKYEVDIIKHNNLIKKTIII